MHVKLVQAGLFLLAANLLNVVQLANPAPPVMELAYASPHQAMPPEDAPDLQMWEVNSKQVFAYVRNDNVGGFLRLVSPAGLWISGLTTEPDPLHVTPVEISTDLHRRGPLYHAIFLDHRSGNFVVTPDHLGRIQSLLLK